MDSTDLLVKSLICNSKKIINSLQAVYFGMHSFQNSKCFCYKYTDFDGNSKIYNQFGLKKIDNNAVYNISGDDDIDNSYILLIQNSNIYLSLYEAIEMSQRLISKGKNLSYRFKFGSTISKTYSGVRLIELLNTTDFNECATIDLSLLST